jgi:hypothetical protein
MNQPQVQTKPRLNNLFAYAAYLFADRYMKDVNALQTIARELRTELPKHNRHGAPISVSYEDYGKDHSGEELIKHVRIEFGDISNSADPNASMYELCIDAYGDYTINHTFADPEQDYKRRLTVQSFDYLKDALPNLLARLNYHLESPLQLYGQSKTSPPKPA